MLKLIIAKFGRLVRVRDKLLIEAMDFIESIEVTFIFQSRMR